MMTEAVKDAIFSKRMEMSEYESYVRNASVESVSELRSELVALANLASNFATFLAIIDDPTLAEARSIIPEAEYIEWLQMFIMAHSITPFSSVVNAMKWWRNNVSTSFSLRDTRRIVRHVMGE